MLIPDKKNTGCFECVESCPKFKPSINGPHYCSAHYCNVYHVPEFSDYYIGIVKAEVKQQPLTDWEKIDLKKQLEEHGKKIKNLMAEVEELRFTVKQILKIKEQQNYQKGEY